MPDKGGGKSPKRDDSYFSSGRKKRRKWVMIVAPVIGIILALSAVAAITIKPAQAVDGIPCNATESVTFHTHSHIDVIVDGRPVQVPGLIGIPGNSCFYWLHTHSTDGIIHEESPTNMTFTLGQFMDIWAQTQSDSYNSLGLSSKPVGVYANGQPAPDYRSLALQSREEIALVIGANPPTIPSQYPSSGPPS